MQPPIRKTTAIDPNHHVAATPVVKHEMIKRIDPITYEIIDSVFIVLKRFVRECFS